MEGDWFMTFVTQKWDRGFYQSLLLYIPKNVCWLNTGILVKLNYKPLCQILGAWWEESGFTWKLSLLKWEKVCIIISVGNMGFFMLKQ